MSNDLISRSELMQGRVENDPVRIAAMCASPAYDVDAVCEELKRLKNEEVDMSDEEPELVDAEDIYDEGRAQGRVEAYVKAIEVVRSGGKNSD